MWLNPHATQAQQYDLGGGLGVAAYSGEMVRRLDQGRVGLQGTFIGRRNFDNVWSLRGGLSFARISGADSITRLDPAAVYRDAYFKGNVWEATVVMEYHFLDFMHPQAQFNFSPYGFFGLGFAYYAGEGRSFALEAPERYNTSTPIIPFGLGIKYRLNDRWILAAELGFRASFTDRLDKIEANQLVIPRFENPNIPDPQVFGYNAANYSDKDWYYFLGLTISYSFSSVKCYAY
ncbi:outer membrane beta-barrel protein [Mongoliitalea daihaiensis]|nr:outer membrane beta-barrel protein [Mongoliitalea daihaiensis]